MIIEGVVFFKNPRYMGILDSAYLMTLFVHDSTSSLLPAI